jgi:hypothetical protein
MVDYDLFLDPEFETDASRAEILRHNVAMNLLVVLTLVAALQILFI